MSTPVGSEERQRMAYPVCTEEMVVVTLPSASGGALFGALLFDAITTRIRALEAGTSRNYSTSPSTILIQAPSTHGVHIRGSWGTSSGAGFTIGTGDSLMLSLAGQPADALVYECAADVPVICYF